MHSMNYILELLEDAKEKINDAIDGIDSFDDEEEPSLPLKELNELIGLGLVPDALIQLRKDGKFYRFIGYGDKLQAHFQAEDEGDAKKGIIKTELETLIENRNEWMFVVGGESKDKGGEA